MLAITLATGIITARAQSSFTTIEYNEKMQPALVLELPNTTGDVEGTIREKLKQIGYNPETQGHFFWKKDKTDGFYVFTKVSLPSVSSQTLDMYFKVAVKNKQEKNNSTLYLMVSNGNENFVSPESDSILWNSSREFLNSFVDKTTAYSLEQDIKDQENAIKTLVDQLLKMQKDEKDLAEKLAANQENQKKQQSNIDTEIQKLNDLKSKRKN